MRSAQRATLLLALAAPGLALGWTPPASAAQAPAAGDDAFLTLRDLYVGLGSVHLRAKARVRLWPPGADSGRDVIEGYGAFEYWAQGAKYRLRCTVDGHLGLMNDVEYAFDGTRFLFLDSARGVLSVQAADSPRLPTALPNPFFAPLEFLSRDGDDCGTCVLKLSDVRDDGLWSARLSALRPGGVSGGRQVWTGAEPALRRDGVPLRARVALLAGRVEQVDWLRPDASVAASTQLRYAPDPGARFPESISLHGFDARGRKVSELTFEPLTLELDPPLAAGLFEDLGRAARVWDSDAQAFVPAPRQ